jgi:subtilisin-like proprotein convertase family protein
MRLKSRTWFLISLLCFLGAGWFWHLGNERGRQRDGRSPDQKPVPAPTPSNRQDKAVPGQTAGLVPLLLQHASPASLQSNRAFPKNEDRFPYRLRNSGAGLDELMRSDQAILLRNALVDTRLPANLAVPAHLQSGPEPGSYIVQSRGALTDSFRTQLRLAGANLVSYIPNNAYLVRVSSEGAARLEGLPQTQAVLPWEPYYKLAPALIETAVKEEPLRRGSRLNLLLFPGTRDAVVQTLTQMKVQVFSEDRSPFGPVLMVRPPEDALVALAQLTDVQAIEPHYVRTPANDLGRTRVQASADTMTPDNYLGLTGAGVLVNVNDTEVEAAHPDLAGRVSGVATFGGSGHGTHVAGTIASSGANGPDGEKVPGSVAGASYRGLAPAAELFALPISLRTGPLASDAFLQETAARTNAFISNNSWSYPGAFDYTFASASWDAAVRDAMPDTPGSQPLVVVAAAGNSGGGSADGQGGFADSIEAPATAKNVITVGAIENFRNITNEVVVGGETNMAFLGVTDSSNQVASFSSRGNVGVGVEGGSGRFKPDLVAPGTFVVSTRSSTWQSPSNSFSVIVNTVTNQIVKPGETNLYTIFIPDAGVELRIRTLTNSFSSGRLPPLFIHALDGFPPNGAGYRGTNDVTFPVTSDIWFYSVGNTNNQAVRFDIQTITTLTNDVGNRFQVLDALNASVGPYYRYESGTSMAAPVVSGLLALMQEYFEQRLSVTNSPALMKALLINGARTLSDQYTFQTDPLQNQQGWGLPNLTNSLPLSLGDGPLRFFDQSPDEALITGMSKTRTLELATNASALPLRVTLVWTDPPGNPASGIKLVNNLDLIVTNLDTGEVFVGNNFGGGGAFSDVSSTNDALISDTVNNVENVYIRPPLSAHYSITVVARRVNVNAVTAHPDGVAQDYALVVSTGSPAQGQAIVNLMDEPVAFNPAPKVVMLTNGVPLLNERVGASSSLLTTTNGVTNQWNFYVLTNQIEVFTNVFQNTTNFVTNGGPYVAFTTFLPPNLSRARYVDADLDLYVSSDPALTNLDAAALAGSLRSAGRGGVESVILTNGVVGTVYYAGVKSEDQQAANFGFFAVASSTPFSQSDSNGNVTLTGFPQGIDIPDGTPEKPEAALLFAFAVEPLTVQNVVVTNVITHQSGGDLLGNLSHDNQFAVLNNHRGFQGTQAFIYDDSDSGEILFSQPVDGPGSLRNFVGEQGIGVWQLTMVDSSPFQTGRVDYLSLRLEPRPEDTNGVTTITRTILPNRFFFTAIDVPADATNLTVCVSGNNAPVKVFVREGSFPSQTSYDAMGFFGPMGGCLSLTKRDSPPLTAGRYYIGVFNPNVNPVTVTIKIIIERDLGAGVAVTYRSRSSLPLLDDAVTNAFMFVDRNQEIYDVKVGVRIQHERASDLVLHLVSPSGTRLLLTENRGGLSTEGYGGGTLVTNVLGSVASGGPMVDTNDIPTPINEGTVIIDYDFLQLPDQMQIFYENNVIFDTGLISGTGNFSVDFGPGAATNVVIVMNPGNNSNTNTQWSYTPTIVSGRYIYTTFTENRELTDLPIKFGQGPFTNNGFNLGITSPGPVVMEDGFDAGPGAVTLGAGGNFSGWSVDSGTIDIVTTAYGMCMPSHSPPNGLDINGNGTGSVSTNFPTMPGQPYLLSFVYTRNPNIVGCSGAGAGCQRSAQLDLGGTNVFVISDNPANSCLDLQWKATSFVFTATSPLTTLKIDSLSPGSGGIFFDTFKVQGTNNSILGSYFLPEESISYLKGENAFGDWHLEIWDNRVGGDITGGQLLSWQMEITFANTNRPALNLTNGIPFMGTIEGSNAACFQVFVPLSARHATNTLSGSGPLDLLFNQTGVPVGDPAFGDILLLSNTTYGISVIDTNLTTELDTNRMVVNMMPDPKLMPGLRYYLCVRNTNPDATNSFALRVDFDEVDTNLLSVIPLTNAVAYTNMILSTNLLDFYSFDVSSNAYEVRFEILNPDGNVDLVARHGLPLPNPTSYDAGSFNLGTTNELIDLVDGSLTLLPGVWYLAVYNLDPGPVNYEIKATESIISFIDLTNKTAVTNVVGSNLVDYYRFTISSNALGADFETFGADGNVDLYIRKGIPPLPGPTNFFYSSTQAGTNDEFITVTNNAATNPLEPGDWWAAVVNNDTKAVNYSIRVTEHISLLSTVIGLTNGVPYLGSFPDTNGVHYYKFEVSPNAVQANFEALVLGGRGVDLFITDGVPLTPTNIWYASTNPATANEFISVATNSVPVPLSPGPWYLAVVPEVSTNPAPADYAVRVTEFAEGNSYLTRLNNNVPFAGVVSTNSLTSDGVDYFIFTVSPSALQANFELYALSASADLYVRPAVLLPGPTNFTYRGVNPALAPEFIPVATNSPIPLRPGDYYLAVQNLDTVDVDYRVQVTEFGPPGLVALTNTVAYSNTVDIPSGPAYSGMDFYSFHVSSNGLEAVFETFGASGDVDLYLRKDVPLPDTAGFDFSSTRPGAADEVIAVLTNMVPVALAEGDWYLAVVNRDAGPVDYFVRASELGPANVIQLSNAVPVSATVTAPEGGVASGVNFYFFNVSSNAIQVNFETLAASGNVDLYVHQGLPWPDAGAYDYESTNGGLADELVMVYTNQLPIPLTPGPWFVTVLNRELAPVDYTIRATEITPPDVVLLTNDQPRVGMVAPAGTLDNDGVDYYLFSVSSNALQAEFHTLAADGDVDLYLHKGFPLPHPNSNDVSSVNAGLADESIVLYSGAPLVPLTPGDWYLAVVSREPNPVTYTVCAREMVSGVNVVTLTNGVPFMATTSPGNCGPRAGIDYYLYQVTTNAALAQFEIQGPGEEVDLVLRKGLPLPDGTLYDYASTNLLLNDELIMLRANSQPVGLASGDWYLGVIHSSPNPTGYSVLATEFNTAGTNVFIRNFTLSSNSLCITWTNTLPGVHYILQGTISLTPVLWVPISPTITATGNSTTFCVPLPSPYQFFRIAEGLTSSAFVNFNRMTVTTNGFFMEWRAPLNRQYMAEWTPSLPATAWNVFTNVITSTNDLYQFLDDGSQTGGLDSKRFYRLILLP